jgi:hypothetical protein
VPPPPQVCGAEHVPQLSDPPQPSEGLPQVAPRSAQVFGVQVDWQLELRSPLTTQLWPDGQVPQATLLPQPSGICPQLALSSAQVLGVQPQ